MFALIKREIKDAMLYFAIAAIFVAVRVAALAYQGATGWGGGQGFGGPSAIYRSFGWFLFAPLVAAALGLRK